MKREASEPTSTRRDFLRGVGRTAALAGVAALAILSIRDGECVNGGQCHGCRAFDDCELPPAQASRAAKRRTETQ